jgi:hypothetical protein
LSLLREDLTDHNAFAKQIWFDGGYSSIQQAKLQNLLTELQPQAVIFNACDVETGECLSDNPGK